MIGLNGQAARDEKGKDQGRRREGSWYALAAGVLPSVKRQELVEGRGFELLTFRLRGAILESFLLNRLKRWAYWPCCTKKGLGEIA